MYFMLYFFYVMMKNCYITTTLQVLLSQGDVKTLFRILGENLQEDGETQQGPGTASGQPTCIECCV